MTRQKTLTIGNDKVLVKVRSKSYVGNHVGFRAWITNPKKNHVIEYNHINSLTADEAIEKAINFYKKEDISK